MKNRVTLFSSFIVFALFCALSISGYAAESIDINDADLSLYKTSYTYNATSHTPSAILYYDGQKLKKNIDYTVAYDNNINAGTATVTVTGIGAFTGNATTSFTINPRKISTADFTRIEDKVYVGEKPSYKVVYNNKKLVNKKDYTVSIANNKKVGVKTATVTITGKGNFTGKKSFKLTIRPARVANIVAKDRTDTTIKLTWDSQSKSGVTGYKVYSCDKNGGNRELVAKTSTNSATIKGLKTGKVYYFVVRSYYTADGTKIHGKYSKIKKTCTRPERITLNSVSKSSNKKKLVVKWQKTRCSGYIIEYSTDKSFKDNVKTLYVKDADAVSRRIKIKKSEKTYYVRVRAYRDYKINSKTKRLYGARSPKISSNYSVLYASFSTYHGSSAGRQTNLRVACKYINGTVIEPGETFNFNTVVGPRTTARGFKQAPVFTGAHGSALGVGGGVCQVASTLFNTALRANLQIVERNQHSQRVSYVPKGMDAAISGNAKNLRFRNNSNYPIKIVMKASGGSVYCKFYVSADAKPKKTKLKVYQNGNHFTLKRYVDGKCNYTTYSTY